MVKVKASNHVVTLEIVWSHAEVAIGLFTVAEMFPLESGQQVMSSGGRGSIYGFINYSEMEC